MNFVLFACFFSLSLSHGQSFQVLTVSEMSHAVNRGLKSHIMETVCQYKYKCKNISPENRFAVNTLALASGGWDVMERDGKGRKGT